MLQTTRRRTSLMEKIAGPGLRIGPTKHLSLFGGARTTSDKNVRNKVDFVIYTCRTTTIYCPSFWRGFLLLRVRRSQQCGGRLSWRFAGDGRKYAGEMSRPGRRSRQSGLAPGAGRNGAGAHGPQ